MLLPLLLALQGSITIGSGPPPKKPVPATTAVAGVQDTMSPARRQAIIDSVRVANQRRRAADSVRREERRAAKRVPVTPALLASAFRSDAARTLFTRVQRARLEQDTSLTAYDATTYQRASVGVALRRIGRERLLFRAENAARVRWRRASGASVELLGARKATPAFSGLNVSVDDGDGNTSVDAMLAEAMNPIPYYPGREPMLPMLTDGIAKSSIDAEGFIHPLAEGAEAYYTFAVGDSAAMRLQDGRMVRIVELTVRPRRPDWKLGVASLWSDASSGQVVRAVYRMSEPMNIWKVAAEDGDDPNDDEDVPIAVKAMINPLTATVSAITIEYGLHEGRWWLPRLQMAEGTMTMGVMRGSMKLQERFSYGAVNGTDTIATIVAPLIRDSTRVTLRDSASKEVGRAVRIADSLARVASRVARERECASSGSYTKVSRRYEKTLPIATRIPCDSTVLAKSSELPASIYDDGAELFGEKEMQQLRDDALALGAQPGWSPQPPELEYGLPFTRYNRVEGLSSGLGVVQRLGAGYTGRLGARMGLADLSPNAELSLARSDGRRLLRVGGYRRLEAMNDWGVPLGLGASLSSVLFGRDEGFYYRTWGAELAGATEGGRLFDWRLFAERQGRANVETQFSLPHVFAGTRFLDNVRAPRAGQAGGAARLQLARGVDPQGLRVAADLKAEAAAGTFDYTRGLADVTATHPLWRGAEGALTLAAGTTGGTVAPQRLFYLGGAQTVRGQIAGTGAGNAFWLGRAEVARAQRAVRVSVFGDLGWAGDRTLWNRPGRPLSGVGIGASVVDGLARLDLSRGIHPRQQFRMDLTVEARF